MNILRSRSRAGLAEALTHEGSPSQIDFKLGGRRAQGLEIQADDHRVRRRLAQGLGPQATARARPTAFPKLQGWRELLCIKHLNQIFSRKGPLFFDKINEKYRSQDLNRDGGVRAAERDGGVRAAERAAEALRGSGCLQLYHPRCGCSSQDRPWPGIRVSLD